MGRRLLASLAATAAVAASLLISSAGPATAADPAAAPAAPECAERRGQPEGKVPVAVQITEPDHIATTLRGVGKQVYDCDGTKYVLREPVAGLFTSRGVPAGIHGKGQALLGELRRFARRRHRRRPQARPPHRLLPWLKLTAVTRLRIGGAFSKVDFIQRIDTRGGVASRHVQWNSTLAVGYSANYVFWAK